ncbi:MAG: ATP-binding protein [Anaerolineaceae bacterium]|nr:ATP-binding protein [Anaerolineaceae bacterium]
MNMTSKPSYPKILTFVKGTGFQAIFTLLTFSLIVFYNAAYYVYVPVTGVWLDYDDQALNTAIIRNLNPGGPGVKAGLQVGDIVVTIDGRAIKNLNNPVHLPKKPGDVEVYVVQRGHQTLTIPLHVGSYADHLDYLVNIIPIELLSLLIYALGLILLFFSRPADIRARLVAIVWVLAGVAITTTGPGYIGCVWLAPEWTMLMFSASIFITTAAHLYFPVPTFSNRIRNFILWGLFGLSLVLATSYLAQQTYLGIHQEYPRTTITAQAINYPFYLSCLASIGLLLKNRFFIQDKDVKRQTGIIFLGTLTGFLPFFLFSELPDLVFGRNSGFVLVPKNISLLFMILVPIAYGYVIYQRKLLKIDFIINRSIVLFIMTLGILFTSMTVLSLISIPFKLPSQVAIAGSIFCVLVTLPSTIFQKKIQIQVDRILYGGYYDYTSVTSDLSNRLAQTIDRPAFINLLIRELPAEMKIEKSALLLLEGNTLELQRSDDGTFSIPQTDAVCGLLSANQKPILAQNLWSLASPGIDERWMRFNWAQLFVPIFYRDTLYGVLILGDRTVGDIYSNQDLQIVGTVGQQAALSISNIILVEALRGLTQQLVRSDEEQRKKVARDLHDSVLQNLFLVKQRLNQLDPEVSNLVDGAITMLRQTIKAQRPSLLDQGLLNALNDMINDMKKIAGEDLLIHWRNSLKEEIKLPDEQATSVYRIVQESLFNVLKHSQADQVIVSARKDDGILELTIEDDGIGLSSDGQGQVDGVHFGFLNMKERATMIGAKLNITSEPGNGTTVSVKLKIAESV